jgi:hypothetical protein
MRKHTRLRPPRRKGAVSVLAAMMMVMILLIVAFALDLGYMMLVDTELQRTADSAAMAGCWELIDDEMASSGVNLSDEIVLARTRAVSFAALNPVTAHAPVVDRNDGNATEGDVLIGYLSDPADPDCEMTYGEPNRYNAVRVRVHKSAAQNGEVPHFFGRIVGLQTAAMQAEATAVLLNNVGAFTAPPEGKPLHILPIALDLGTWNNLMAGGGSDNWAWNDDTGTITAGADGVREVNLYPDLSVAGTAPGNRGTVDIGSSNNSTADIARQIVDGVSAADLDYHGGELKFDDNGELFLNGDTGISAGVKDELASIKGDPRAIPVFSAVMGPGNNAEYTIVRFVGIRIMDVKLSSSLSSKKVIVQPANVMIWGGKSGGGTTRSDYVYSPVWLAR